MSIFDKYIQSVFRMTILLLLIILTSGSITKSQEINKHEFIKQLNKLVKFTEWPDSFEGAYKVTLFGKYEVTSEYTPFLENFTIKNKNVLIIHTNNKDSIANCQIIIFLDTDKLRIKEIIDAIEEMPTLTVTPLNSLENTGIIIHYTTDENLSIPIKINSNALKKTGIYIDSILLSDVKIID